MPLLKEMVKQKKQGFTLMELVIVVIIIGILASLMYPEIMRAYERSMDKQAISILKAIRTAERSLKARTGKYWPLNINWVAYQISVVNTNLNLDLLENDPGGWILSFVGDASGNTFNTTMLRSGNGYDRLWWIDYSVENSTCIPQGGSGCP
jgi:prepilin-type N-terminal cleavage/methylation domain-containing protein